MADNDNDKARPLDKQKIKETEAWQHLLKINPAKAEEQITQAVERCRQSRLFHPSDLDRFRSQMLNGVATPSDFDHGRFGKITRA